ncbi:hypothetical protein [Herbaspirillum huttiense]|uniref:hypothetical protein n=1 Tax=Herbaspirillum huttiense TaxID=863372 RepID=UPI0039AF229D
MRDDVFLWIAGVIFIGLISYIANVFRKYMREAGLEIAKLEADLKSARLDNTDIRTSLNAEIAARNKLENQLAKSSRLIEINQARDGWCNPRLLEMAADTPKEFQNLTLDYLRKTLINGHPSLYDLTKQDRFKLSGQWGLYWCLTYASQAALRHTAQKIENGISNEFLSELKVQAANLSSTYDDNSSPLQIGFCAIYEQARPGLKEEDVGADILLIIAGKKLTPDGGARLLWIQAKRSIGDSNPYVIHCAHKSKGDYQLKLLRKVHQPDVGSIGLYINYNTSLPFIPSFSLSMHSPDLSLRVDLAKTGARFSEVVMNHISSSSVSTGSNLATHSDVINFLQSIAPNKPLFVVVAAQNMSRYEHQWNSNNLVKEISRHYEKILRNGPQQRHDRGPKPPSPGRGFSR